MEHGPGWQANHLLAEAALAGRPPWFDRLEPLVLAAGQVVHESGERARLLLFPTSAVISLAQVLRDGDMAEIAIVGAEGMLGSEQLLGGDRALGRALVVVAGGALRLDAVWLAELREPDPARSAMLRHARVLLAQCAQAAACHRHHALQPRLARWLLQVLDRSPAPRLRITQERVAGLLGVRREGVTEALGAMARAGILRIGRGRIDVLDSAALESRACECRLALREAGADGPSPTTAPKHNGPGGPLPGANWAARGCVH